MGTGVLMCSFFQQGRCEKGELCTFSHGDEPTLYKGDGSSKGGAAAPDQAATIDDELAQLDQQIAAIQQDIDRVASGDEPLTNFGENASAGRSSQSSSGIQPRKVRLCMYWNLPQGCRGGEFCKFAHGEEDLGTFVKIPPGGFSAASSRPGPRPAKPQTTGSGIVPRKVQMCSYYNMPQGCTRGATCKFAHGEHELGMLLGTPAPNSEQGASAANPGLGALLAKFAPNPEAGMQQGNPLASMLQGLAAAGSAADPDAEYQQGASLANQLAANLLWPGQNLSARSTPY